MNELGPGRTRHLVAFSNRSAPADFDTRISGLGGQVDAMLSGSGIAIVSGLTSQAVAEVAAYEGIEAVAADMKTSVFAPEVEPPGAGLLAQADRPAERQLRDQVRDGKWDPAGAANYPDQWNMRIIQAPAAWEAGAFGSPSVRVYLLDTGIDYTHPDLRGHVDTDRSISLVPGDVMGEYAAAEAKGVAPYMDFHSHGTAVASTIVSNGVHFAGVTTRTKIVAVKVLDRTRVGDFSTFIKGIEYAVSDGADIIHVSLAHGGFARTDPLNAPIIAMFERMTTYAHEQGVVIVAAAGNNTANLDDGITWRSCNAPFVICVSATRANDQRASYTNYGINTVTVAGPGGEARPGERVVVNCSGYSALESGNVAPCAPPIRASRFATTGTTYGAAATTGLLALIIHRIGRGQPTIARQLLEKSVDDLGPVGRDAYYGYGRINVSRALVELADYAEQQGRRGVSGAQPTVAP